ncbi:MAG: NAD(P)H-dependent oxidoreductase [Sneathiella sp.]
MTTLLNVTASARTDRSISRDLSAKFIETWLKSDPATSVINRNIGLNPPEFISESWIAACFTPLEERTAVQQEILKQSDILIQELEQADILLIASPMYNYGMPAALKAWTDMVIRVNKTFSFDLARGDYPLAPLFSGKTLICLTSTGEFGFGSGGIREAMNHLEAHISTLSHYLGVTEKFFIRSEYQEFADQRHTDSRLKASEEVVTLAARLASMTP